MIKDAEDEEFERIEKEVAWRREQTPKPFEFWNVVEGWTKIDLPTLQREPRWKEWRGLTDVEIEHAYMNTKDFVDMARVLEDILKGKNT
jgi:hypothetical protein